VSSPNKDRSAILNKVGEYLAIKPWCTPQQAVASVCDAIRYTWGFPVGDYSGGVAEVIEKTKDEGYLLDRLANFWPRPDFKGITSVWRTPEGQFFEQQFHIAESCHARDFTFQMYDRFRQPGVSTEERQEIRALIREIMAAVPVPPGAEGILPHPLPPPGADEALPAPPPLTCPAAQVSWYAVTELRGGQFRAVARRTVAAGGEHDEAFARDSRTGQMRWRPTSVIYSAERGDLAHWFTIIDEGTASLITGHLRVSYGTG
jgi:hypothetical protein